MKVHFNKFEKTAGLFVGLAILSCVVGMTGIAVKNGWFSRKVHYATELESADGVHAGTVVQISGLRVGSVTDVELGADDHVRVKFEILERFREKVRADSRVRLFRPFILTEKVLDVSSGTASEMAEPETVIPAVASYDVMDLLSGKKMSVALSSFDRLAESLRIVGEAFSDPRRTQALVRVLDRLDPLVKNLDTMAAEIGKVAATANKQKRAETIVANLAEVSQELSRILPAFNQEAPNVGAQLGQIVSNLNVLTTEFKKVTPAISVLAPELPQTTRRAVEALDQTVVLLKALQKSFLLRGSVKEVRDEESRRPANTSEP